MVSPSDVGRMDTVERELATLQQSFRLVVRCLEEERLAMLAERSALQTERSAFERMQERVGEVNAMRKHKVTLNIGGSLFETSVETLTCEPGSMLEAMFSGRFAIEKDDDGASFIDRDPTYFPLVLSYLRDARQDCKPKRLAIEAAAAEKALREAQFYGLEGLERLIIASTSLVVAQDGSSKYTTVSSAIRDAKQGDRILVQAGHYFESITIEKNIDIQGEGQAGDVVLAFSGEHVVTGMCEKGSLRNVSVQQQGDEYHCLFITNGCLVVEGCEFASAGWACVGISGQKTQPLFRNNKITASADNGVIILNKGKGVIEGNDIMGYTLQGIEIREESNPIIRGNRIHHGKDSGIYINTKGRGLIEGNEIHHNEFNGIAIKFEGHPRKVTGNRIFANKQRGIYVSSDSSAEIVDNDVFGNAAGDVVEE
jgi:parallel beta-helix repeat protein